MKNVINKFMGAALFVGLTAASAGTVDEQASILETAAKKPKSSPLAVAKKEGRDLAKEMHALWKESNEIAAEARAKKITDDTCADIDFGQVLSDIKSLKKDFTANIEKQNRLGGLNAAEKKQRLDGLDTVEKGLQDNVKVIREGCPQTGMRDAIYRIVADVQQKERTPEQTRIDNLGAARLDTAKLKNAVADDLIYSVVVKVAAQKKQLSREICNDLISSGSESIDTDTANLKEAYAEALAKESTFMTDKEKEAAKESTIERQQLLNEAADKINGNLSAAAKACARGLGA
jgi:hypothetical protein